MASKAKSFHPVQSRRTMTVSGGLAAKSKEYVLRTREFAFTRGDGDALEEARVTKECVLISHQEPWLCEMATGSPVFQRPLKRVKVATEIKRLLEDDSVNERPDSKMSGLAFDEDDDDGSHEMETPKKTRKKVDGVKKGVVAAARPDVCKSIQMPKAWRSKEKITIRAAFDSQKRLWLDLDFLPWLVHYVKDEKASGGVQPVESEEGSPKLAGTSRIYWNFRDGGWIARALTPTGVWLRTTRGVARKQKSEGIDFQLAKQLIYEDLEEWVKAVRAGAIVNQEDDGDA